MATTDVPGAKASNNDVLAMGCWAEHVDGSLILVEGIENGSVIYSIFDVGVTPPVEYRDAMPEAGFKDRFSWPTKDNIMWTWHDKTPFPWDRVMQTFPAGDKIVSAADAISAAARVADSLDLRAEAVARRHGMRPTQQTTARGLINRLRDFLH